MQYEPPVICADHPGFGIDVTFWIEETLSTKFEISKLLHHSDALTGTPAREADAVRHTGSSQPRVYEWFEAAALEQVAGDVAAEIPEAQGAAA